jgi:hypothetical protein
MGKSCWRRVGGGGVNEAETEKGSMNDERKNKLRVNGNRSEAFVEEFCAVLLRGNLLITL